MEARGFFERGDELTSAPRLRVAIGFGPDRVAGATALVDTGADICVFPASLFPWPLPGTEAPDVTLTMGDGITLDTTLRFPSITAGDIREIGVPSAVLPGATPILGRSFLNRLALRITAAQGLVHLRTVSGHQP